MATAPLLALRSGAQRLKELRNLPRRKLKVLGQHTHDGVLHSTQIHRLPHHIGPAAESLLPRAITQQHHRRGADRVLTRKKIPAQHGLNSQGSKEPRAYLQPVDRLRAGRRIELKAMGGVHIHGAENRVHPLPVDIIRIGEIAARKQRQTLRHLYQPRGIRIGQRLDQRGIDKREDGHTGADAQRQNHDRRGRKPWVLSQLPERKTQVLRHGFKAETDNLVAALPEPRRIAELTHGPEPRRLRRHALSLESLLGLLLVKSHLFVQFQVKPPAAKQDRELAQK